MLDRYYRKKRLHAILRECRIADTRDGYLDRFTVLVHSQRLAEVQPPLPWSTPTLGHEYYVNWPLAWFGYFQAKILPLLAACIGIGLLLGFVSLSLTRPNNWDFAGLFYNPTQAKRICEFDMVDNRWICKARCEFNSTFALPGMESCSPWLTCDEVKDVKEVRRLAIGFFKNASLSLFLFIWYPALPWRHNNYERFIMAEP